MLNQALAPCTGPEPPFVELEGLLIPFFAKTAEVEVSPLLALYPPSLLLDVRHHQAPPLGSLAIFPPSIFFSFA